MATPPAAEAVAAWVKELAAIHACPRCVLRQLGSRNGAEYSTCQAAVRDRLEALGVADADTRKRPREQDSEGVDEHECAPLVSQPCPLCLGVLQSSATSASSPALPLCVSIPQFAPNAEGEEASALFPSPLPPTVTEVESFVEAGRFASTQGTPSPFCLEVTLPACLAVRARVLHLSLERACGTAPPAPVAVKDALRYWALAPLTQGFLNAEAEPRARSLPREEPCAQEARPSLRLTLSLEPRTEAAVAAMAAEIALLQLSAKGRREGRRGRGRRGAAPAQAASERVTAALGGFDLEQLRAACPLGAGLLGPLLPEAGSPSLALTLTPRRDVVCVGGRYLKLRRGVPQTTWLADGGCVGLASVEERLAPAILAAMAGKAATFMSSGREDIDVRMLGSGRPFALQIAEPRWLPSPDAVRSLQDRLNAQQQGFVEVRHLCLLDAATVEAIKKSSSEHQKSYAAVCWAARKPTPADFAALAAAGPLVVAQQTPVRVLHRRSNAVRERTVYSMSAHALVLEAGAGARDQTDADGHWFVLRLTTQAGTYIKEFVHGDMGRTSPSLGDLLGCETRIAFLDVTDVHDDGLLDH